MIKQLAIDAMSWVPWIIIPLLMEFIPSIGNFILLIIKKFIRKKEEALERKLAEKENRN